VGLFIGLVSIFGFLLAVIPVNIYVSAAIVLLACIWLTRYVIRKANPDLANDISRKSFIVLASGTLLLAGISCILVREHGDTDAIGNWNFAAKYIADPQHWNLLLKYNPIHTHPDYPMGYFGATAFFWRLFQTQNEIVPLALTLFATLSIPVLIFLELCKKHLGIATLVLALFILNPYYLNSGLNQYADTLLSFYILAAFITINHYKTSSNKIYLLLCTASLGAVMWVKNEGVFCTIIFGLAYFRTFVSKDTIRYSVLGALPFIIAMGIFKIGYSPANDLLASPEVNGSIANKLTDKTRYKLIAQYFLKALDGSFYGMKLLTMLYLGYSIVVQKNLSKNFYVICIILAMYLGIYLITPRGLEWHLTTSFERLLLQLYPTFLLLTGFELANIKIPRLNTDNK
jgi:hypothetical protein